MLFFCWKFCTLLHSSNIFFPNHIKNMLQNNSQSASAAGTKSTRPVRLSKVLLHVSTIVYTFGAHNFGTIDTEFGAPWNNGDFPFLSTQIKISKLLFFCGHDDEAK